MQGSILFNGNIHFEVDFIHAFRDLIVTSGHENEAVRRSKKTLLICSAWMDDEYNEAHIKGALRSIGIPSRVEGGFDQNLQNLAAWHEWRRFEASHPEIGALYRDCLDTILEVKRFYKEKNGAFIDLLRRHTALIKQRYPGTTLADILGYNVAAGLPRIHALSPRELLFHHSCQEIQGTLAALVDSDERQARICAEVYTWFFRRSRVGDHVEYRRVRAQLVERILSSASIFIFGGSLEALFYTLRFWQLGDALKTALALGTNFYTTSAGSMILCDRIIVFDDFQEDRGLGRMDFEFFDHGFGLVSKIRLFPHCMERVKTDDPDNLTYLAYRFEGPTCVGLNQESFLRLETYVKEGRIYESFRSIGRGDGVYVFDPSGRKVRLDYGEELSLPGTWEGDRWDG